MNDKVEASKADYDATLQYFLHLAEVRFKLLAAMPAFTGLAVALVPKDVEPLRGLAIALLGLFVTIGITIYDQRNTQIYDRLVMRAKRLEKALKSPVSGGAFTDRPKRRLQLTIGKCKPALLWHDLALAIIYSACLGTWSSLVQHYLATMRNDSTPAPLETAFLVFGLAGILLVGLALRNDYECG